MEYRRAKSPGSSYFFTLVTHDRRPFLCEPENINLLRDSFRQVQRQHKQEQAIWQRRFREHLIRDEEDYRCHVDRIHYNPVFII